ncbi:AAA family ATPase [Candidatus Gracilibacteria bacterium]|nr:AAA family ATPase [Candidatus Gracilibacteria bacterium]MCF7898697.1 AAA family ATPase [Candidatus Paceibacterota bacterium]
MKFSELSKFVKKYSNVVYLNQIVVPHFREVIIKLSLTTFIVLFAIITITKLEYSYLYLNSEYKKILLEISSYNLIFVLITILMVLIYIFFYSLHTYSRYFILLSIRRVFGNNKNRLPVTYEAASALIDSQKNGFVKGLLSVPSSNFIIIRLLISLEDINEVSNTVINKDQIVPEYDGTITLGSLWKLLYENSEELRKRLLARKIQKEIYFDTCDWLDRILENQKRNSAWWWRENLSKTRGIAKFLSYGRVGYISRYASDLSMERRLNDAGKVIIHKEAIEDLEEALSRGVGPNAVIVGNSGTGRHTIIKTLSQMIDQGNCYNEIEHKRVFEFDNNLLIRLTADQLVNVFEHCFEEAAIARNVIFVLDDFDKLYEIGKSHGLDIFQLLEGYISHRNISIVCICNHQFYQNEEHKSLFDKDFQVIHVEDMNSKLLIPFIQDHAVAIERLTGKFFTSHSINVIATSLNKYFAEESPLVEANDLMYKIATSVSDAEHIIIDEESVSKVIKSITGVSTGEIQLDEKEKLIHLEETLHKKVIGQSEALKVVASTMRRSRVGLVSANKPIGSFLFLGPTGVGKTETAKTLAEVFFGSEEHMSRIDMNEYTMDNSSYRLLGDENHEGDIAKLIHGRPYGVMLLDELEKSTSEVKDIFLRILDEGVFTNGAGKIISAKTQIIIATSNAGSDYIRESGLNPSSTKEEIESIKLKLIDNIVEQGMFRPEFINRFDAVVVFHPLAEDTRILIANKMLEALKHRVMSQGYEVTFTDDLVQKVLGGDEDIMYGGRAIQRNIQSKVEEALAKKMIEGSLNRGEVIVLDAKDID